MNIPGEYAPKPLRRPAHVEVGAEMLAKMRSDSQVVIAECESEAKLLNRIQRHCPNKHCSAEPDQTPKSRGVIGQRCIYLATCGPLQRIEVVLYLQAVCQYLLAMHAIDMWRNNACRHLGVVHLCMGVVSTIVLFVTS